MPGWTYRPELIGLRNPSGTRLKHGSQAGPESLGLHRKVRMRLIWASGALLLFLYPMLAQGAPAAGPPQASFAPVTGTPIPVVSASGRFSSLNPPNRLACPYDKMTGRVVSPRLILVKQMDCGRAGHDNVLVN